MRRTIFSSIIFAALVPASSVLAAPNAVVPSSQYLNQISEKTFQIEAEAEGLEAYLRSGARDTVSASAYTVEMSQDTQKLGALLDQFVLRAGTTNETRQQVERMKMEVAELQAFIGNAYRDLDSHSIQLHVDNVLANTANIVDRDSMIRNAAQNLASGN
jgi:hypothetical protein